MANLDDEDHCEEQLRSLPWSKGTLYTTICSMLKTKAFIVSPVFKEENSISSAVIGKALFLRTALRIQFKLALGHVLDESAGLRNYV